jgi:branched-chain amino acid transport system substrate-binding protein
MLKVLSRRAVLHGAIGSVALASCKGSCQRTLGGGSKGDTIKVGVVLTLSGPQGGIGKELQQGVKLALGAAGMQAAGKKFVLIERDDKNEPSIAVAAVKELIEKENVDLIIGPSHSHIMLAIRNIIHESKTILINPSAGATQIAGAQCSPYIFVTGRMNPLYAEAMGRYLSKSGKKSVAVLAANYAGGVDMVQGFKDSFVSEAGGKIVGELLPPLNTTDFSPFLTQLKSLNAEAVFAFFTGDLAVNFIKAYDATGLKGKLPLYVTGYTVEQDVLPQQGDSALGILSVSVYAPMLDNSANKKFAPSYKEKYDAYPSEYSVLAYDAGQLLVAAVNEIGGKVGDTAAFANALSVAKIDSPRGPFKLGPNHTPVQDAYLREVVRAPDGKLLNKVIATAWPNYYYPGEGCTLPGVKR